MKKIKGHLEAKIEPDLLVLGVPSLVVDHVALGPETLAAALGTGVRAQVDMNSTVNF